MWNALSISASGLAASAAQFTRAASKIANASGSEPVPTAQPAPAPPSKAPAAPSLSPSAAVPLQSGNPQSWMVEILAAKSAYRANAAAMKAAAQTQQSAIDLVG